MIEKLQALLKYAVAKEKMGNKGQLGQLVGVISTLIVGIVLIFALITVSNGVSNANVSLNTGLYATLIGFMPIVLLIVVIFGIIGLLTFGRGR